MTTQYIWNTYSEDVKRFVLNKIKNEQMANDLLQDIFIKIHSKLGTLHNLSKLKSWVFTIARNTVYDHFKSNSFSVEITEDSIAPNEESQTHTEKDCLYGILKNLPKKYRKPLFLSDIKGLKQEEVANLLNLPLPTIKSQIQRTRKLIKQGYIDCCNFEINKKGFLVGEIKEKQDCKVCG